jgi:hypothetical protein
VVVLFKDDRTQEHTASRDVEKERVRQKSAGKGSRNVSKERKEGVPVQSKEIVFLPQVKESSSSRGRSMNRRIARTIITHSSSLNPKRVELPKIT